MNDIVFVIVEAALDILWFIVVDLLNMLTDVSNSGHEGISELLVNDQSFLIVADAELCLFVHGVRVEKASTCKTGKILAV